ncbi:hypothetical protein BIV57_21890 [Mangrovactinospora gilvigrisea]|uniref:Lipoprotein n=1 Tax=Mangrovactinospora gilvigrisea TaxID=1428644 RepID=A0A1J7B9U5_9ACTN|nr:hypothetical protein [Mangrovactinospora gilvigrisea]OIV35382.1 hypothetical protein BIV57_21890 [Mangrovactinospora gilvigrisea]
MHHVVHRRAVLSAAAGLAGAAGLVSAAGCSSAPRKRRPQAAADVSPSAEAGVKRRGAAAAEALVARYDATLRAHPPVRAAVAPLRAEAARHAKAFGGRVPAATASVSASASASASASPPAGGGTRPAVPADPKAALRALASQAQSASDARLADVGPAGPQLARLTASVAASWAGHAELLGKAAQ